MPLPEADRRDAVNWAPAAAVPSAGSGSSAVQSAVISGEALGASSQVGATSETVTTTVVVNQEELGVAMKELQSLKTLYASIEGSTTHDVVPQVLSTSTERYAEGAPEGQVLPLNLPAAPDDSVR